MPMYLYRNPLTEDIIEVFQGMNDEHVYSEDGVDFERVFTVPQASIDAKIDPFSRNAFLDKTNKGGTLGDIMDRSKELSERRKDAVGHDTVKEKYFDDYSAKRKGRKHQDDTRQKDGSNKT